MLYNKDWDKPKHKPTTMASVIAWLETKNPDDGYYYSNADGCLAGQYNQAMGREYDLERAMSGNPFKALSFDKRLERIAWAEPRTFGAALERARKTWF